ncbi:hypothetical protein [Francisella philomiragia]|uniref:hypothetical protein n=1 Tax=Francisella philomiragia TaxID=28110 RepID=UPI00351651CE
MSDIRHVLKNLKISPYETLNKYTPYTLTGLEDYISRRTYKKNIYVYLSNNKFIDERKSLYFAIGNYKPDGFNAQIDKRLLIKAYFTSMQNKSNEIRSSTYEKIKMTKESPWLWLTDDLTGCTVLIAEYDDNSYGMTHLRPNDLKLSTYQKYFKYRSWNLKLDELAEYKEKNISLAKEALEIVQSKSLGSKIRRYILVQSEITCAEFKQLNIVGIYGNDNWRFFIHAVSPIDQEYEFREIRWRNYSIFKSLYTEYD